MHYVSYWASCTLANIYSPWESEQEGTFIRFYRQSSLKSHIREKEHSKTSYGMFLNFEDEHLDQIKWYQSRKCWERICQNSSISRELQDNSGTSVIIKKLVSSLHCLQRHIGTSCGKWVGQINFKMATFRALEKSRISTKLNCGTFPSSRYFGKLLTERSSYKNSSLRFNVDLGSSFALNTHHLMIFFQIPYYKSLRYLSRKKNLSYTDKNFRLLILCSMNSERRRYTQSLSVAVA